MEELQEKQSVKPLSAFIGAVVFIVVSTGSLVVLLSGNGAYKQWSGAIFMTSIASLIVFRSLQEFIGNRVVACVPYILATFLSLSFVASFAPSNVSLVVWAIYIILVGVAGFYWLIHIIVDAVKSLPLPKGK